MNFWRRQHVFAEFGMSYGLAAQILSSVLSIPIAIHSLLYNNMHNFAFQVLFQLVLAVHPAQSWSVSVLKSSCRKTASVRSLLSTIAYLFCNLSYKRLLSVCRTTTRSNHLQEQGLSALVSTTVTYNRKRLWKNLCAFPRQSSKKSMFL